MNKAIGAYVHISHRVPCIIAILRGDGTMGTFFIPKDQIIMWSGYTGYVEKENILRFVVRNQDEIAKGEKFTQGRLEPGKGFSHENAYFSFLTDNIAYWEEMGKKWEKLGEEREFDFSDPKDLKHVTEVQKLLNLAIDKYKLQIWW